MPKPRWLLWLGVLSWSMVCLAGDPTGVDEALRSVSGNWPEAQFSVDVLGLSGKDAVLGQPLQVEYEAAHAGFLTYIRVTSHGDMALAQQSAAAVRGMLPIRVEEPLGQDVAIFLFSDRQLDKLSANGSDQAHAQTLAQSLSELQRAGARVAVRRYELQVTAPAGQTQYTTRSIVRTVEANRCSGPCRFPTRIEFDFNSDQLTQASRRDLDVFGQALVSRLRNRKVTLEGHTDSVGSDDYNLDLSVRRAHAARQYLMESFGLAEEQLTVVGLGKANPIAPNDTAADRGRNRRVDFIFPRPDR